MIHIQARRSRSKACRGLLGAHGQELKWGFSGSQWRARTLTTFPACASEPSYSACCTTHRLAEPAIPNAAHCARLNCLAHFKCILNITRYMEQTFYRALWLGLGYTLETYGSTVEAESMIDITIVI